MPVALPASRRWKFGSATIQPESNYINSITEYVSISTNMHLISFSILLIQVAAYALPATSLSIYRRADSSGSEAEREPKKVVLDGNEYTATPLPSGYQGYGELFRLEGGFQFEGERVPAIMTRLFEEDGSDNPDSRAMREIDFLKRVSNGLYLFNSKWSKAETGNLPDQIDIVVRDLRKLDDPFKPFHEWYEEDKNNISGILGTYILCKNIKEQLLWYATEDNLLYNRYSMNNIFIKKQAYNGDIKITHDLSKADIIPVVWEPQIPGLDILGVVDFSNEAGDEKDETIDVYKNVLDQELEQQFAMDVLKERIEGDLRKLDVRHVKFQGTRYRLLQLRHIDRYTIAYEVEDGFKLTKTKMVPAIMVVTELNGGGVTRNVYPQKELIAQSPPDSKGSRSIMVYKD